MASPRRSAAAAVAGSQLPMLYEKNAWLQEGFGVLLVGPSHITMYAVCEAIVLLKVIHLCRVNGKDGIL